MGGRLAVVRSLTRAAGLTLAAVLLTACADGMVRLRYAPDPTIEPLTGARPVTVFHFADARGDEGDQDPRRVGGVYNGYGMRYQRIMTPTPWPAALAEDLGAALSRRGVPAVAVTGGTWAPGTPVATPLVLDGEIHNFSTEGRWLGLMAHVSGIVRLRDQRGTLLVEKAISARVRPDPAPGPPYETMLNEAVRRFVRQVVTDPDLTRRLAPAP